MEYNKYKYSQIPKRQKKLRATPMTEQNIPNYSSLLHKIFVLSKTANSLTDKDIAHDIKNALGIISIALGSFEERAQKAGKHKQRVYWHVNKFLDVIEKRLELYLTNKSLFSPNHQVKFNFLSILEYVTSYLEFLKHAFFIDETSLVYKIKRNFTSNKYILIDEYDLIFSVLNNLIKNSLREITSLNSDTDNNKIISILIDVSEKSIIIIVSDTGKGFPSQVLESFKKDQRYTTFQENTENHGFGLLNVKRSVERAKGTVNIYNDNENHACVVIELPLVE
ncbi:MAG: sensor histidine kinase [Candidatus Micrarchaeota archaeon]|nr:sensor histidine kinase [Candidatus Micrarchaeota archaeon]